MSYDYHAKGVADHATGNKDERLYELDAEHGRLYREGWRQAARNAESPASDSLPVCAEPPSGDPPAPVSTSPRPKDSAPDPAQPKSSTDQLDLFNL